MTKLSFLNNDYMHSINTVRPISNKQSADRIKVTAIKCKIMIKNLFSIVIFFFLLHRKLFIYTILKEEYPKIT